MFFRGFMAQYVEKWRAMVDTHKAALVEAVKNACIDMMEAAAPAYPHFTDIATQVVTEVRRTSRSRAHLMTIRRWHGMWDEGRFG